jgi:mannose/fructose/N-acetylgalactosamine-specific phosphotransferase system component IID
MLLTYVGELAVRALVGAAVGLTTYKFVVSPVRAAIAARFSAAGDLAGYVGYLGIDAAVTIVLSAIVGRMAVNASKAFFVKKAS